MAHKYEWDGPESVVEQFLESLDGIEDCVGFIGWVGRENGTANMVCAASPTHIAAFIKELEDILFAMRGPTKDDTIQ